MGASAVGTASGHVLEMFQEQSRAPAGLLIWQAQDGTCHLFHSNTQAVHQLGVPRVELEDPALGWDRMPAGLAGYLHNGMAAYLNDPQTTLPVFEVLEPVKSAFSVKLFHEEPDDRSGHWFYYVFNEVTAWISLQEEVMNARRLESIGALASGVAHDFNNLLMVIRGHAEFITPQVGHDESMAFSVDQIKKACQSGAGLTQSLLGFARKQSLVMQPMNAGQLVAELVELCRRSYGARYQLEIDPVFVAPAGAKVCHPDLMINGCAAALGHCVLNILNNARDSMPEGGRIQIRYLQINETIQISVIDEGVGIDAASLKHVFEPFYTTKSKGAGTGLGLSLAHSIMKQHAGDIRVESQPGVGTKVTFVWPKLAVATEPVAETVEPQSPVNKIGTQPIQRAFLIDDDEMVLRAVAQLLESNKVRTTCFSSAEQALAAVADGELPSMIFVDYTMPGTDGITFMRQLHGHLRKQGTVPLLKMVLISGHPPEFFDDFLKEFHGAPIYLLQKPFSAEDVTRIIRLPSKRFHRRTTSRVQIGPG
jgi:two-component system, cell cycle sensor histidine kinase and response regulator CckA